MARKFDFGEAGSIRIFDGNLPTAAEHGPDTYITQIHNYKRELAHDVVRYEIALSRSRSPENKDITEDKPDKGTYYPTEDSHGEKY